MTKEGKIPWLWRQVGVERGMDEAARDAAEERLKWVSKGMWWTGLAVWGAIGISVGLSWIWDRLWGDPRGPIMWDVLGGVFILSFLGFFMSRPWWLRKQREGIDEFAGE